MKIDEVLVTVSRNRQVDQAHSKFMEVFSQLMQSFPEYDQDKLLDLESGMNAIFNLGCEFAYEVGLKNGRRMPDVGTKRTHMDRFANIGRVQ